MAQKLGPNYEVEVNALGGRTVKRDQKDGNGTGKSLSGKLFNGMVSLPAVLSENLPLDIVIVMLGTNDANSRYKNNAKAIADDLEEMIRMIQAGEWQSNTKFKTPKVLVIAPPLQPNETAYGDAFSGAEKITKELPPLLQEKCRILGAEYINAQDFVKGIPGQIDRVHLSPEQHKVLGEGGSCKGQRNLCALIVGRILGGLNETSDRCRCNYDLFTYVRKCHGSKHSDQSGWQSLRRGIKW